MSSDSNTPSDVRFSGTFDEQAFRSYVELHLMPHDKKSGWWIMVFTGALSFFWLWIFFFLDDGDPAAFRLLCLALGVCFFYYFLIGIGMITGLRHPLWGTKRWDARTAIAFARMQKWDLKSPVGNGESKFSICIDKWPNLFSDFFLLDLLFMHMYFDSNQLTEPIAYDLIPGLLPRFKNLPQDVDLRVTFSGAFYPDRIEKGSHGDVFAPSYTDVYDVVEDQKRYPGLAIIRHKNGFDELVVFTDQLEGATWEELKPWILAQAWKDGFPGMRKWKRPNLAGRVLTRSSDL